MSPLLKNILAILSGIIIGMIVNMSIVMIGPNVIPPPNGANVTTAEGLKAAIHLFQVKHFIFPFLAHALGTFAGAWMAARLAAKHHLKLALGIGFFFLAGGIANVFMLPSPAWFNALDLIFAYLPMSYLAATLAMPKSD
jgi:hypothetical protein